MSSSQVKLFNSIDLTCLELIGSSPAISTIAVAPGRGNTSNVEGMRLGIRRQCEPSATVGRRGRIPQPVVAVAVAGLERRAGCRD